MSKDLTDKAIESNKKAESMASKPVLSTQIFLENVTKLKNHFDEIDDFRAQISKEAAEERKLFEDAKVKLDSMKVMNKNDVKLLDEELVK
jgi:hypothetical protein